MSKRIEDLEARISVLEAQRDRVRYRLSRAAKACFVLSRENANRGYPNSLVRRLSGLLFIIGEDLERIDHEYDRYYIEPKAEEESHG